MAAKEWAGRRARCIVSDEAEAAIYGKVMMPGKAEKPSP